MVAASAAARGARLEDEEGFHNRVPLAERSTLTVTVTKKEKSTRIGATITQLSADTEVFLSKVAQGSPAALGGQPIEGDL